MKLAHFSYFTHTQLAVYSSFKGEIRYESSHTIVHGHSAVCRKYNIFYTKYKFETIYGEANGTKK